MPEFYVSAPGKVILFGEHLAVYGKPAIAAALSLRCYLQVTPSANNDIVLEFPDIDLVHRWSPSELPWDKITEIVPKEDGRPLVTDELVPELVELLEPFTSSTLEMHRTACRCFLYLYASLCHEGVQGHHFCIRLTLPIGAGLGLSALTAVSLASALGFLGGQIGAPKGDESAKHDADAAFIDAWSLAGERCFHGNPSGIDNAVATFGGAVWYQRTPEGPVRSNLSFAELLLLLTNTKVPRSTAALVGGVAERRAALPASMDRVLDAMEHVVRDAHAAMVPVVDRAALAELVRVNHGLLVSLGVSHPALEKVRMIADAHALGATKLTGAGGGGCAITLLADGTSAAVEQAQKEFALEGFECFSATLGGHGVGMRNAKGADNFASMATGEIAEALGDGWSYW